MSWSDAARAAAAAARKRNSLSMGKRFDKMRRTAVNRASRHAREAIRFSKTKY